jgi:hypothetical protein
MLAIVPFSIFGVLWFGWRMVASLLAGSAVYTAIFACIFFALIFWLAEPAISKWADGMFEPRDLPGLEFSGDMDPSGVHLGIREIERTIRGMIEHENQLMHNRIQWFLTIIGFLITAIFLSSGFGAEGLPIVVLSAIGFLISLSFWLSLRVGLKAVENLVLLWDQYKHAVSTAAPSPFLVGVLGSRLKGKKWNRLMPWWILPPILMGFWIFMACLAGIEPATIKATPSSTYVYIEPGKLPPGLTADEKQCKDKIAYFNTSTGKIRCVKPEGGIEAQLEPGRRH